MLLHFITIIDRVHIIDYIEEFAHVAHLDIVCLVISPTTQKRWAIFQLDVESTFLHGDPYEEIFTEQSPGYVKRGDEHIQIKRHCVD